jgi:hypothetical protein
VSFQPSSESSTPGRLYADKIKATLQSWSTDDELIEINMDGQAEMVGRIEAISNTVVPDIGLLD